MPEKDALQRFPPRLSPSVITEIAAWSGDPELGQLYAALIGHANPKSFLDTYAEAVVALHLRQRGCDLRFEVPTPQGKACDFEVEFRDLRFFLHVKRVDTERPSGRRLAISSRLRSLERISRPYVVSIRWHERASDDQMLRLVRSATEFIRHARVGDELVVHDDDGTEIGGVLVVAPWDGSHVTLVIGLPSGFIDEAPRIRRLLRRACRQFMPRATNVILICSSSDDDLEDFDNALLGSHIERWDAFPPRGRRIAHGRSDDGIWHGRRYGDSRAAGWFRLAPETDRLSVRLRFRDEPPLEPRVREVLEELFE